ncbi:MAG: head GIN domain-containing protein [Bacteroidales bacterium]
MSDFIQNVDIKDVTRVVLRDYGQLFITQGDLESLRIEAGQEVLRTVKTYVSEGELVLDNDAGWFDKTVNLLSGAFDGRSLKFYLTVKRLDGVFVYGAGRVRMSGLKTKSLFVTLKGAGELILSGIEAGLVDVDLPGAGIISLSGKTDTLKASLKGAGSLDAPRLESREARVTLKGVGKASVWATSQLDAHVDGVGAIEYHGNPEVRRNVSGLGSVIKR